MRPSVLVTEEVPALRHRYATELERSGCAVLEVGSLDDAVEIIATSSPPDVMIIDEGALNAWPEWFGVLRSDDDLRRVLVIALSAGVRHRRELIDLGIHGVVGKPLRDGDLGSAVRWVLGVYGQRTFEAGQWPAW